MEISMTKVIERRLASMFRIKKLDVGKTKLAYDHEGNLVDPESIENPLPAPEVMEAHQLLIDKGLRVWLTPAPRGKEEKVRWAYNISYQHPIKGIIVELLNRETKHDQFLPALEEGMETAIQAL